MRYLGCLEDARGKRGRGKRDGPVGGGRRKGLGRAIG